MRQRIRLGTAPGRHVLQQGPLAGVEFHDLRHVGIDRLVIRDAGARRVGDGDPAGAVDVHDAGHAELAFGIEVERVEVIVVDPAVEHVDRLVAPRRAHGDTAVDHPQVARLHQFHAHLVGQERMFEIGGIVDPRRHHRDGRRSCCHCRGRGRQRLAQIGGIALHRLHPVAREEFREHLQHRLPVLEHIADAGGRARIVLEHEELARPRADEVDPDDMGVDPARRADPDHLRQVGRVAGNHRGGQATRPDDFLLVVDVIEEGVDRPDTLFDAARQLRPFGSRNDPRDDVEGYEPLFGLRPPVDVEGDAGQAKEILRLAALGTQPPGVFAVEPVMKIGVSVLQGFIGAPHFVIDRFLCHGRRVADEGGSARR